MIVATRNSGKTREFESLLGEVLPGAKFLNLADLGDAAPEVEEDGLTFEANAIKKALEVSLHTGVSTMSDDSGLVVDALGGAPGVISARWATPDGITPQDELNNRKLVESLQSIPELDRTARYVAVICLCLANDAEGLAIQERLRHPIVDADHRAEGQFFRHQDRLLVWFKGTCEGRIVLEPKGDGGFGYDPYFFLESWGQTMAEVPLAQKNTISHRAQALRKLAEWLG